MRLIPRAGVVAAAVRHEEDDVGPQARTEDLPVREEGPAGFGVLAGGRDLAPLARAARHLPARQHAPALRHDAPRHLCDGPFVRPLRVLRAAGEEVYVTHHEDEGVAEPRHVQVLVYGVRAEVEGDFREPRVGRKLHLEAPLLGRELSPLGGGAAGPPAGGVWPGAATECVRSSARQAKRRFLMNEVFML